MCTNFNRLTKIYLSPLSMDIAEKTRVNELELHNEWNKNFSNYTMRRIQSEFKQILYKKNFQFYSPPKHAIIQKNQSSVDVSSCSKKKIKWEQIQQKQSKQIHMQKLVLPNTINEKNLQSIVIQSQKSLIHPNLSSMAISIQKNLFQPNFKQKIHEKLNQQSLIESVKKSTIITPKQKIQLAPIACRRKVMNGRERQQRITQLGQEKNKNIFFDVNLEYRDEEKLKPWAQQNQEDYFNISREHWNSIGDFDSKYKILNVE